MQCQTCLAAPGTAHLFFTETSPADATPNGSHMYLYVPEGQEKVVSYDGCSSSFKLYSELMLISMSHLTQASQCKMLLRVRPL